jgi:hypothetical protein
VHLIADALFAALAEAHRRGVVHRDIKPANVIFDGEGRPFLTDFGVASLRDATGGLTATGAIVGTPEFMAPEQARGEQVGPPGDVFSLGATLLFGATGHPPYGRADPAVVLQRAARGRLVPLPADLDRGLRRRLQPTLARSPQRRPTAAAAAGTGPRVLGQGHAAPAGPAGTEIAAPPRRGAPKKLVGAAFGAIAAVAVILTTVALAARSSDEAQAPPESTVAACVDSAYQPCGQPPAPNTDGTECLAGFFDLDGDVATGCEVESDQMNGTVFDGPIVANLVPHDAVDRYPFKVPQENVLSNVVLSGCSNVLEVTLTAPPGVSMRLDVLDADNLALGSATSADGVPATLRLGQPSCFADAPSLVAQVSWVGSDRSGESYTLSRKGSW